MLQEIRLKGRTLSYDLQRKKVKNINLRIKADQSVSVSANPRVPLAVIEDFMQSKADFILRVLNQYADIARNAPPTQLEEGETLWILGQKKILRLMSGTKNTVICDESHIILKVRDTNDYHLKKNTLEKWKAQICREIVMELCQSVYPYFQSRGVAFPELRFRYMKSRWGSCQPQKGVLTFNCNLAEKPLACVEYVVVHEFTHFLHPDHSANFHRQMSALMPDWKARKKLLEQQSYEKAGETE